MKDLAKEFFSSKAGKTGIWVLLWLFEYIFFSWCVNKLPDGVIRGVTFIGDILIIYAVYYWIIQKHSTECQIYTLIILEFVFYRLNQESVFVDLFKCPFWIIYIILLAYLFIRIFVIERVCHLLHDIYWGFKESNKERMQQRIDEISDRQAESAKEKAEKVEYIRNRSVIRRQFWSGLRDKVIDFFLNIIDFFVAILSGLFRRRQRPISKTVKAETIKPAPKAETGKKNGEKADFPDGIERAPKWVYVVVAVIAAMVTSLFGLLLYYQFYVSQNNTYQMTDTDALTKVLRNLSINNNSVELVTKIISLCIIDVILLIVLMIIAFIVFVVVIQIIKSGNRMVKDLIKSINDSKGTDHSSTIFYSFIVFIICFFIYKLYPFDSDDFAELLSNGAFIIYPVMAAVFIPIITTIIDVLKSDSIAKYLGSERVKKIKDQFSGLALGTLEAMLNYITFVTKDFLQSIQELSIREFEKLGNEVGGNNGNNTGNGSSVNSDDSSSINNSSNKNNK